MLPAAASLPLMAMVANSLHLQRRELVVLMMKEPLVFVGCPPLGCRGFGFLVHWRVAGARRELSFALSGQSYDLFVNRVGLLTQPTTKANFQYLSLALSLATIIIISDILQDPGS